MRWKPMLGVGAVLTALAMVVGACGEQQQLGESGFQPPVAENVEFEPGTTMAALAEAGRIRIGTKFDQPLFGQQRLGGELTGFDTEIGRIIAGQLGIAPENIEWVEAPSGQREELLQQDRVDMVVATYTINDQRRERISFAGPYYVAGQALMVQADNDEITGVEALRPTGARVCSVEGSASSVNVLPYINPEQLTTFDVYSKCADALRTDQVDAVTTDNVILLGFISESEGQFKLVGDTFTDEPYGIGISRGDVAFCEFINASLTEAAESGVYAEAWESTAGEVAGDIPELPEFDPCS